jgi:hydroxymethylglutaryl-CoA synthase
MPYWFLSIHLRAGIPSPLSSDNLGDGFLDVGIVGYGAYVPRYRIRSRDIALMWGQDPVTVEQGLGIKEKAVPGFDEDTITIGVEASKYALARARISPKEIGAIYVGSESHPYAVKPSGTVVAAAIGAGEKLTCADFEFACKAGTAGIQTSMGLVGSGAIRYGLAIGADTAQGAPGDPLEYAAAAGGAAFIIGSNDPGNVARIDHTVSMTTDTPDFWRREGQSYPKHGGRFTGEPAYFKHVVDTSRMLMRETGTEPEDYTYAVFHMPNKKFPERASRTLGFEAKQVDPGLVVEIIGNTYSGCSPLGLCAVFDVAKPGDRILLTSYGSGAGSDSFAITVQDGIEERRDLAPSTSDIISRKEYVDYATYAKLRGKLQFAE